MHRDGGYGYIVENMTISRNDSLLAPGTPIKADRMSRTNTNDGLLAREDCEPVTDGNPRLDGLAMEAEFLNSDMGVGSKTYEKCAEGHSDIITLASPWIAYEGSDILWLPHEYRGNAYAAFDRSLVIGQASGAVSFITFR